MRHTRLMAAATLLSCAMLALTGCGEAISGKEEAEPTSIPLTLLSPTDGTTVKRKAITVRGTTDPNARLTVNGEPVDVAPDGSWSTPVKLTVGDNRITVEVSRGGGKVFAPEAEVIFVERAQTAAEIAAEKRREEARIAAEKRAEEERAAREKAKREQAEQDFKDSAQEIDYGDLSKNADEHEGEKVRMRGQVFQIQESGGAGFMLLSVTDEGYGFWTDNVWVNYTGGTSAEEEDVITVYGTVVGSKSYETQIGGETYVPEVNARYIDETG